MRREEHLLRFGVAGLVGSVPWRGPIQRGVQRLQRARVGLVVLDTGRFLDYRNREDMSDALEDDFLGRRPGASYNQWLANVLLAMGLPAQEWERPGEKGYGGNTWGFDDPVLQLASDPLPFLQA